MRRFMTALFTASVACCANCGALAAKGAQPTIPTEVLTLANGLKVVLHVDRSDPIVSVAVMFHTGSSREKAGKTGFAHLFEHILFQESEHVGQDEFFRRIQEVGGTLNGGTWEDGTIYYEVVPRNALETVLWMESDRMGWLLGALTPEAFFNQQNVVMNESRQSYANRPYGYQWYALGKLLYPEDHPYNWQVIGSMSDLAAASVDDAREFFKTWYGPNNATLVLAGDFDVKQAKSWIEKYFGEIPSRPAVKEPLARPGRVPEAARFYFEDKLAGVPMLTLAWPSVPSMHRDEPALSYLSSLLASNKRDVLYRRLVEEKKLTSRVDIMQNTGELAGAFLIQVKPLPGVSLAAIEKELMEGLKEFAAAPVVEKRLAGEKAKFETSFLGQLDSVFTKALVLAQFTVLEGGPEKLDENLAQYRAVSEADIKRVMEQYILGKPYVALSVVPAGKRAAAAPNSKVFSLPDDDSVKPKEPAADAKKAQPTPSKLDRSKAPQHGPVPELALPKPYRHSFSNGMTLQGVEANELPLVQLSADWLGGHWLEAPEKAGLAWLAGSLLKEGTKRLTPAELQDELDALGATVSVSTGTDAIRLEVSCLARNLPKVAALMTEMVQTPRLDAAEFDRLKSKLLTDIEQRNADAGNVASDILRVLIFGGAHPAGAPLMGTKETVSALTLDDVRGYYREFLGPDRLVWLAAGAAPEKQIITALESLEDWKPKTTATNAPAVHAADSRHIFVVDFPGAKQSEIRVGTVGPEAANPSFYPATIMNYGLGGNFASVVNMILREEKGYTYGARTTFGGGRGWGAFMASSAVQTSATGESIGIVLTAIRDWQQQIPAESMEYTRSSLLYGLAREFETLSQRLDFVRRIAVYGLAEDFVQTRQKQLRTMTAAEASKLAAELLPVEKLVILAVGDAKTIVPQLEALKERPVQLLDKTGTPR